MKKKDPEETTQENEETVSESEEVAEEPAAAEAEPNTEAEITAEEETESPPPEVITALQESLAATQAEAEKNLDGWQRAQAEFSNYKKRIERDREQFYKDTTGKILKRYLEVIDDLALALKNRPEEAEGAKWAGGIELIYRKLLTILENEGVKPMEADGHTFDPTYHEAISQEESPDHESGQIIEVIQQGYLLGDRVLRPAKVRVAS
jgi:molecular chaperone GrpE